MQNDVHYYCTYLLCRKAGVKVTTAKQIAWANGYVDAATDCDLHGIQTQCAPLGNWEKKRPGPPNWADTQIQHSVIVPFHFMPPNKDTWVVEANSANTRQLVETAYSFGDPFQFGVAAHTYQDSWSHQGFTGWIEDHNACKSIHNLVAFVTPNCGHADFGKIPDEMWREDWIDYRTKTGKHINNRLRLLDCAVHIYELILACPWAHQTKKAAKWEYIEPKLNQIYTEWDYDKRAQDLLDFAGGKGTAWKNLNKVYEKEHRQEFINAARAHLSESLKLMPKGLK